MAPSRDEQNLLVGALALQLEFVNSDQLADAATKAAAQPDLPLEDILLSEGAMSRDECDLLAALVKRQLARHGNDPARCLASCENSAQVRQVFAALNAASTNRGTRHAATIASAADPHATAGVSASHPRTPAAPGANGSPNTQTLPLDAAATLLAGGDEKPVARGPQPFSQSAVNRFRVIKPFARGGLGQVSLARDQELNREVALKEILPRQADNEDARQRFLMEAEITGSLEHPGVVPVYGLGQYGDGRPFYAMRLIRGDNLQSVIEEYHANPKAPGRDLKFRQLLGRFIDVCNAIGYAHDRCVLHRDLKPSNIMLGMYGETIVVDWGLAKVIGSHSTSHESTEQPLDPASVGGSTATLMGRVVGTPAYMSPEQAAGRIDLIGPATDIYSLGATLYHILTGKPPFGVAEQEFILASVQVGRFESPRVVNPKAPKPLEAVCLKAMARDSNRRYPTARALADDIERYLADEPVAAHREPVTARVWRWMRRHRTLVLSSAAILAGLAVALAVGIVLLNAANRNEQRLRKLADIERTRAQSNFEMARDAVRNYYMTISEDTLLNQTGMQPLRDQLLRQALAYYQHFLESEEQEAARSELANANYAVGRITETIDSAAKAIPYYRRASRLAAELAAESPDDPAPLYEQGRATNAIGGAYQGMQRWDEAQKYYREAEVARQKLVDRHPDNAEYIRTLANTIMNQGSIDAEQEKLESAIALWDRAQKLRRDRLKVDADDAHLQSDFGKGEFNQALFETGKDNPDFDAAKRRLTRAIDAFERVRRLVPDDLDNQYRLATAYRVIGDRTESTSEAREFYRKAFPLLQGVSLRNPRVREYKALLADLQLTVAEMLLGEENFSDAVQEMDKGLPAFEELAAEYPEHLQYRSDLGFAYCIRGEGRLRLGDREAARADLTRAFELLTEADKLNDDPEFDEKVEKAEELLNEVTQPSTSP